MSSKGAIRGTAVGRPQKSQGYAQQFYSEITSPENRAVVTSIVFFAAGVTFLSSSWAELLLPPI